jgi:DNA-binding NtrC family response regulator
LVDTDRIRRSTLARALVRERSQVTAVESLEELGEVVRASDDVQVAVLDGQHPARLLLVEMILDRFPAVSLVVRSTGEAATRTLIQALGVEHFEVLPGDASSDAIVEAVRRLAAIPR